VSFDRSLLAVPNDTFTVALLRRWRAAIYFLLLLLAVVFAVWAGGSNGPVTPLDSTPSAVYSD
jgi:hypothetical protein